MHFFPLGITWDPNDFHTVLEWKGNLVQGISRGNEHHIGKIVIYINIVIIEGIVLFRVENFKEGGRGISPEVGAHLINFIQKKYGVVGTGFF
mgnify:CR=1 FL=1